MKKTSLHATVDDGGKRPIDGALPDPGFLDWKAQRLHCGASVESVLKTSEEARRAVSRMPFSKRRALVAQARAGSVPVSIRPLWIHPSATKMVVESLNIPTRTLTLENGDGATVMLRYRDSVHHGDTSGRAWDLTFSLCDQERTVSTHWNGFFTEGQIRQAFLGTIMLSQAVRTLYDPGYFYRHGQWLSIPVKGTGERNSPVLGIMVTKKIQDAVSMLLASK